MAEVLENLSSPRYVTKQGLPVPTVTVAQKEAIFSQLRASGLTSAQIAQDASFSVAMVVRYALGLSAAGAHFSIVADHSLEGMVALLTARHLLNSGATGRVMMLTSGTAQAETENVLRAAVAAGLQIISGTEDFLAGAHLCIIGLDRHSDISSLSDQCNESAVPFHAIEFPFGVDRESGIPSPKALYISSTICLGYPLEALTRCKDNSGRIYVADIGVTGKIRAEILADQEISTLFAEQPVQSLVVAES